MSLISEQLRPSWLKGLNDVNGKVFNRFVDWVDNCKDYIVIEDIQANEFILTYFTEDLLLKSFAYDINRFSGAAYESFIEIKYDNKFPKSHAWKFIKCYYAAYYAANSILRTLGTSCTNFEKEVVNKIENIADAYDTKKGVSITKGYYACEIDTNLQKVKCKKIQTSGNKGSHEQLWEVFLKKVDKIIAELSSKSLTSDIQDVILKLYELRDNLTFMGCNAGNWLSKIRNDINYKQKYGVWFPYKEYEAYFKIISNHINDWKIDPMEIDIKSHTGKPMLRFLSSCSFIVAINRCLSIDMSNRCSKGKSFHSSGSLIILNKL